MWVPQKHSHELLSEKTEGPQYCQHGSFLEIELSWVTDSKKSRITYVSS